MRLENNYKTKEEDSKLFEELSKHRYKCKCGHVVIITKQNKTLCTYCGKWVFKNDAEEFKYRLMEKMKGI
jgi:hypothetical protein